MAIKHAFVSEIEDGLDETVVRPINWNAAHIGGCELFIPCNYGTNLSKASYLPGYIIDTEADEAIVMFYVPLDFVSIAEVRVLRIARATATHRLNYHLSYGALGESFIFHSGDVADQDTAETVNVFFEQDISGALADLAAGDYVGIRIGGDSVNVPKDFILGVRFKYN